MCHMKGMRFGRNKCVSKYDYVVYICVPDMLHFNISALDNNRFHYLLFM